MDFTTFLDKYGVPLAGLAILSWFAFHELWPWLKTQIEKWQTDRAKEREEFLAALSKITLCYDQQTDQIGSLAISMEQLATAIKNLQPPK